MLENGATPSWADIDIGAYLMRDQTDLIELTMEMRDFSSEWLHCDRISSYISRMISHNRADALLYSNLLNSALNELLETVFINNSGRGSLRCAVKRRGNIDIVEFEFVCDEVIRDFYDKAKALLSRSDIDKLYEDSLINYSSKNPYLGLLEIVADYNAKIAIRSDQNQIILSAELALQGAI